MKRLLLALALLALAACPRRIRRPPLPPGLPRPPHLLEPAKYSDFSTATRPAN